VLLLTNEINLSLKSLDICNSPRKKDPPASSQPTTRPDPNSASPKSSFSNDSSADSFLGNAIEDGKKDAAEGQKVLHDLGVKKRTFETSEAGDRGSASEGLLRWEKTSNAVMAHLPPGRQEAINLLPPEQRFSLLVCCLDGQTMRLPTDLQSVVRGKVALSDKFETLLELLHANELLLE